MQIIGTRIVKSRGKVESNPKTRVRNQRRQVRIDAEVMTVAVKTGIATSLEYPVD